MSRVDYYDDPTAPEPNSRKPSASVVVLDRARRLLLLRRTDTGRWTIPTGGLERGESIQECGRRECQEETGVEIEILGLVGIFSDPRHVIAYSDGEVRQPVNICMRARPTDVSGQLDVSGEASDVRWVSPSDLDDYDIHPTVRRRIDHGLCETAPPHVD